MPEPKTQVTFSDLIDRIDAGGFADDIEEGLRDVVGAVQESGKTGKLKLEIKIKPASEGNDKQLFIVPKVDTTEPKPTRPPSILYADEDARLHGSDPDQMEMELRRPPEEERAPLRKVENG